MHHLHLSEPQNGINIQSGHLLVLEEKLVSFCPKSSSGGASEVSVHNLVTEDSLVNCSSEFESSIQNGERSAMRVLCYKTSQESETKLLTHLGFTLPVEEKDIVQEDLSQEVNAIGLEDTVEDSMGHAEDKEVTIFANDNGEDFFNNLPSPKADTPASTAADTSVFESLVPNAQEMHEETDGLEESSDPSFHDSVQLIAHVGGAALWESTLDRYLKMNRSPYLKVVSAMVNNDLLSLVNTRSLKFWKETLALLCTFAQREEWTMLCDTLASKLMIAGKTNTLAATLCYICAGNIDTTVENCLFISEK
ncbi:hypothetical protein Dsin_010890 [Dipteronia sinensis]|uniref:Uncharacterized protein n=1 Tax=Dipteronia sinensis TaxID=43782 RepID=A0AAE0AU35_9ROSI|nr:hypothetical protein Dsin_010890 [Dipteronia sinensis]